MKNISILVIFILRFLYIVPGITPTKICAIAATELKVIPDKLPPKSIPASCEVVCYGVYYLDNGKGSAVTDIAALEALANDKRIVYVRVSYSGAQNWNAILSSMSSRKPGDSYDTCVTPLIKHLKAHSITGVVLDKIPLFGDCDTKLLSLFIQQLKTDSPDLKVCLLVDARLSASFANTDLKEVNGAVDFYVIDLMPTAIKCSSEVFLNGRFPTDDFLKIVDDVSKSSMEKTKLIANFMDQVTTCGPNNNEYSTTTYAEFCDYEIGGPYNTGPGPVKSWCRDFMAQFADNAQSARNNNYTGIMISYLEYDDYTGEHCIECGGSFPVANTYLDVFDGKALRECSLIDGDRP